MADVNADDTPCRLCGEPATPIPGLGRRFHVCSRCGLIFSHNPLSREETERHYRMQHTVEYDNLGYAEKVLAVVRSQLEPQRILDFGSGSGKLAEALRSLGYMVDTYEPMCDGDFDPARFGNSYDLVVANEVLEHVSGILATMDHIHAACRPGGVVYIGTLTTDDLINDPENFYERFRSWWYKDDLTHVSFYNVRSFEYICSLTERYGFTLAGHGPGGVLLKKDGQNREVDMAMWSDGLTKEQIINICSAPASDAERVMLDAVRSIDSLTNQNESLALYRLCGMLPPGVRILEIGSFNGASAVAMGHAIQGKGTSIYCIDPWSNYVGQDDFASIERSRIADDRHIIDSFMRNTAFLGEQIKMMRGFSTDFAGMIAGQDFDLIFIDGAHDYDSVRGDILMCMAALKPGGLLLGHDYHSMGHGVRQAVNELIGCVPSLSVKGTIDDTFIWFARVEDPGYEITVTEVNDVYAAGDISRSLELALAALQRYKTSELYELAGVLKHKLALE